MQQCQPCACKHGRCNPFKQKALANLQGLFTCRVIWRKERDSNPRYRKTCKPDFESGAFDHSAIFPQMFGLAVAPVVWRRVQNLPEDRYCSASERCCLPTHCRHAGFSGRFAKGISPATQSPSLVPRARDDWYWRGSCDSGGWRDAYRLLPPHGARGRAGNLLQHMRCIYMHMRRYAQTQRNPCKPAPCSSGHTIDLFSHQAEAASTLAPPM